MPRTKPSLEKRRLIRALKRFRQISPELEAALMDPDPQVRIRAQLPLCGAVIEDPATTYEARQLFELIIGEVSRILPKVH